MASLKGSSFKPRVLWLISIVVLVVLMPSASYPSLKAVSEAPTTEWSKTYWGTKGHCVLQTTDEGYLVVGSSESSYNDYLAILIKTNASGNEQWRTEHRFRNYYAGRYYVVQASDGGYALAGTSEVEGTNPDTTYRSLEQFSLVKYDSQGILQWNKTYYSPRNERVFSLIATAEGGYALLGLSEVYGGYNSYLYLLKTDSNGNMLWNKTYGSASKETPGAVVQTEDGGFAVFCTTLSFGSSSGWIIKTDSSGDMLWNRVIRGIMQGDETLSASAVSGKLTKDGGYIIAGTLSWFDQGRGQYTGWAVKTDSNGYVQWNKTYGDTNDEFFYHVVQTRDGGYVFSGNSVGRAWVVNTDAYGDTRWSATYEGSLESCVAPLVETSDGGYVLTGASSGQIWLAKIASKPYPPYSPPYFPPAENTTLISVGVRWRKLLPAVSGSTALKTSDGGYMVAAINGTADPVYLGVFSNLYSVLIKTDAEGNELLTKTCKVEGEDATLSRLVKTSDGGYALAGERPVEVARSVYFVMNITQFCMAKVDSEGSLLWSKTYVHDEGAESNTVAAFIQLKDGGYLIAGTWYRSPPTDVWTWLVKTDSSGNVQWNKTVRGGYGGYLVSSVVQTVDGGFTLIGTTTEHGGNPSALEIIELDSNGDKEWSQTYGGSGDAYYSFVRSGIMTADGGYLLAGGFTNRENDPSQSLLIKTDTQGKMVWNKTYEGISELNNLLQAWDGGYVFSGLSGDFVKIVQTSASGEIVAVAKIENPTRSAGLVSSVVQSDDGEFVFTGKYMGIDNMIYEKAWLVKIAPQPLSPTPQGNEPEPGPFPTTWVVAATAIIAIGVVAAILVYFRKIRKTTGKPEKTVSEAET